MRLKSKVLLSLGIIWMLFLSSVYIGAHHYLLSSLLRLESEANQEIIINRYAYTQTMNHYVMLFIYLSILVAAVIFYLLRTIFAEHSKNTQQLQHTIAEGVKNAEILSQKISLLEKRAEKSDKVEGVLHTICDHLNSIVTSLSVIKEKIPHSKMSDDEIKSLINETTSMNDNLSQINHIIKSFQE